MDHPLRLVRWDDNDLEQATSVIGAHHQSSKLAVVLLLEVADWVADRVQYVGVVDPMLTCARFDSHAPDAVIRHRQSTDSEDAVSTL